MKRLLPIFLLLFPVLAFSQGTAGVQKFFDHVKAHCGKSYEGYITEITGIEDFLNKQLIMHVRHCHGDSILIAFHVGENRSRTWILILDKDRMVLKHDHRRIDGTPERISHYGGRSTNEGNDSIQFFPADQETFLMVNFAATNVWWITIDETFFSYNLRRMGTDRAFSVRFDLRQPVDTPTTPWGWE